MAQEKFIKISPQVSKRGHCAVGNSDLQIHGPYREIQFFHESPRSIPNDLFASKRLAGWAKSNRT